MNRLITQIPTTNEHPHPNPNEAGTRMSLSSEGAAYNPSFAAEERREDASRYLSTTAIQRFAVHTLRLFLFAAVALASIGTASAVHFRKHVGNKDYLIDNDIHNIPPDVFDGALSASLLPEHLKTIVEAHRAAPYKTIVNSNHVVYANEGFPQCWRWTSRRELDIVLQYHGNGGCNCWTANRKFTHAGPGWNSGDTVLAFSGYGIRFSPAPHHFGNTLPYTDPLVTRIQDTRACYASFSDCPEHTRPIIGAGNGLDINDTRHRIVLQLPNIRDADVNLDEAFFEFQKQTGGATDEAWRRINPSWPHDLKCDHPNLGLVTVDEHFGVWMHFYYWDLHGAGTYKFRGYVRDTEGNHSIPSESQLVQIWGPPEPKSLRVDTEAFYEGRTHTLYAEAFHPNGIETRANIYLEGKGIDGRKRLNDEELTARGYQSTFSHTLRLDHPGDYRVIVELTDERGNKSTENLTLDITCHPKIRIRSISGEEMVLAGYDFKSDVDNAERPALESALGEAIDHYNYLVSQGGTSDEKARIVLLRDYMETGWKILQTLYELGRGGEEFQKRERQYYYSFGLYYYNLTIQAQKALERARTPRQRGVQLARWFRYSTMALAVSRNLPPSMTDIFNAEYLRNLSVVKLVEATPLVRAYAYQEEGRLLRENGYEALGNARIREGEALLLEHLKRSGEKIQSGLGQPNLSVRKRHSYYKQVFGLAEELETIIDAPSIDGAACEYLYALIDEAKEGERELINSAKIESSDGRSYAFITVEQSREGAISITATNNRSSLSETFTTDGSHFTEGGESLYSLFTEDRSNIDFNLGDLDFTLDAKGSLTLNAIDSESKNVILEVSMPGTLKLGSAVKHVKSLTFSGHAFYSSRSLSVEDLILNCDFADLRSINAAENINRLSIKGSGNTHLTINDGWAPSLHISNVALLGTSGNFRISDVLSLSVIEWANTAYIKANELNASVYEFSHSEGALIDTDRLNVTATSITNEGMLMGRESQSIRAKTFSNELSGKLASKNLRLTGFTEATNAGTIGATLENKDKVAEVSTDVTLQGFHLINTGEIQGKHVTFDITAVEGKVHNKKVVHADQTLIFQGEGTLVNAGNIESAGTVVLNMANLLNTGTIRGNAGIEGYSDSHHAWSNGENGTLITNREIRLLVHGGLVNEGEHGDISAQTIHFLMPTFTNRKKCMVSDRAELNIKAFVQDDTHAKFIVGDASDEGTLEFLSSLETYTNEGEVVIRGSVKGDNLKPLIVDNKTQTWGEVAGVFDGDWEITDAMHLFGDDLNIHVTGDLVINEGAALTCVGKVNGEDYTAGKVTITVGGNFINKGTFTGGKRTELSVSSTLNNNGKMESIEALDIACSNFLTNNDTSIESTGALSIKTDIISSEITGIVSSLDGSLSITSKGSFRVGNARINFGQGGLLESSEGNIHLSEPTRIQSTSYEHNLKMHAPNGVCENEAGSVLVFGDLLVEARDIVNTRKRVGGMIDTGHPANQHGYLFKYTRPEGKRAEYFVQGALHFLAKSTIRNHGGMISSVGDLHFTATYIDNQDQILPGIWRTWHEGRKRGGVSKHIHSDGESYWESRDKHSALVGACIVGGSAYFHIRGDFEEDITFSVHGQNLRSPNPHLVNSGHIHVEHDLNVTTDEGREYIVELYNKMDPSVDRSLVAAEEIPQSGLVFNINISAEAMLAMYPIERAIGETRKKYVYVSTIQYNPEGYAKANGINVEDITIYPDDAAYILPEGMTDEEIKSIPHMFDPTSYDFIMRSQYALHMSLIRDILIAQGAELPQEVLNGNIPLSPALLRRALLKEGKVSLEGGGADNAAFMALMGGGSHISEIASGEGSSTQLVASSQSYTEEYEALVVAHAGNRERAMVSYFDNHADVFGDKLLAFWVPERMEDGTLAWVLWSNLNYHLLKAIDTNRLGEGTIITGESLHVIGSQIKFSNTGHIDAGKTLTLQVGSVDVEAPVFEYDITVEERKGVLGGTRSKTFTIREVQPGGVMRAVDIVVESEGDIVSIGGHILADNDMVLKSKKGNIIVQAQDGSQLVSWNAGTFGRMLGKAEHALQKTYSPSEIKAGGFLELTAEELGIIVEASTVLGEEGVLLAAKGDVTIEGKTTKTRVEDSVSNHGLSTQSKMREEVKHYDAVVASTRGELLILTEGSFKAKGATLVGAKGLLIEAKEGVDIEAIKESYKSSDGVSGFDTFGYSSSETHRTHMAIFPTRLLSGGDLTITSGQDVILSATHLNALGDITVEAGENLTIQGEELIEESTTKGRSLCASFFGSQAFEDIEDDRSTEQIIDDFIREDPLGAALIGLKGVDDAQDAIAQALQIAVQLYYLQKSFDKVGDILENGMPVTDLGVIGQRLGFTDASGNFSPRITLRLGWSKSYSKLVSIIGTKINGENVYLIAHNNLTIKDGTEIHAEDTLSLDADGDVTIEAGIEEFIQKGKGAGLSFSYGSGLDPSVGVDGYKSGGSSSTQIPTRINAPTFIVEAGAGLLMRGVFVETERANIKAKRFKIESIADRTSSYSNSGSINTSGSISGSHAKSDSAWVNVVTGIHASDQLDIYVEGELNIVGAIFDGPDEATNIDAGTLVYSSIEEFDNSHSVSASANIIWDKNNLAYGTGIPGSVEFEETKDDKHRQTQATVSGTSADGSPALNISDLEHSDDPTKINTDLGNVQTEIVSNQSHVHVYIPVPGFVLKGIHDALFADEVNENQKPMSVDEFDALIVEGIEEAQTEHQVGEVDPSGAFLGSEHSFEATFVDGEYHEARTLEPEATWGYTLADESGAIASKQVFPVDLVGALGEVLVRTRIVLENNEFPRTDEFMSDVHENIETGDLDIRYRNGDVVVYASINKEAAGQYQWYPAQEALGLGLPGKEWLGVILSQDVLKSAISGGDRYAGALFEGANKAAHNLVNGVLQLTVGVSNAVESFIIDPEDFMYKSLEFTGRIVDSAYGSIYKLLSKSFYQEHFGNEKLPQALGELVGGGAFDAGLAAFTMGVSRLSLAPRPKVLRSDFVDAGKNLANALPESLEFARVIKPDQVDMLIKNKSVKLSEYIDSAGNYATETFITTSEALPRGLSKKELAKMLTIEEDNVGAILRFKLEGGDITNLATPHNRFEMPGFVNGGKTDGGLPEFVIPNRAMNSMKYELEVLE